VKEEKARYEMPSFFAFYESCGTRLACGDWAISQDMLGICGELKRYLIMEPNQKDAHGHPLVLSVCDPKSWYINEMLEQLAKFTAGTVAYIHIPPKLAVALCLSGIIHPSSFSIKQEYPDHVELPEISIDGNDYTFIVAEGDFGYSFVDCNGNTVSA